MAVQVFEVELPGPARGYFTGRDTETARSVGAPGNLSHSRPHAPSELARNRRHVAQIVGVDSAQWHLMRQVHGSQVAVIDEQTAPGTYIRDVDALVTTLTQRALVVQVADCLPVLFAGRSAIGVAHAGRRGLASGVLERTVEMLRTYDDGSLHAVIGPAIGGCCYEVPPEMFEEFVSHDAAASSKTTWGSPSLDLVAAAQVRLAALEVTTNQFGGCTRCGELKRWFSHREDPAAGRFVGMVVKEPSS